MDWSADEVLRKQTNGRPAPTTSSICPARSCGRVTASQRAYDQIPFEEQQALPGSTLERQGVKRLASSEPARAAFLPAAAGSREHLDAAGPPARPDAAGATVLADHRAGAATTPGSHPRPP